MRTSRKAVCVTRFRPECKQLLFLYQGGAGMFFIPPMRFLRLTGANKRNLSLLRDPDANYYHGKLHPDYPDIEASIERQRQIKRECAHATEYYCSGTSMGGYASILFGHYLEADIVYAFGAQTRIKPEAVDPALVIPAQHRDLALLLADWNGRTRYHLYYSEGFEPDRTAAERLAHCPGVELFPVPGTSHNVFKDINAGKLLRNLFPPLQESTRWSW
jgi:hypothetical protein